MVTVLCLCDLLCHHCIKELSHDDFAASITSQVKKLHSMTLLSHTQAATIVCPIRKTTCPLFPLEDRSFLPHIPISLSLAFLFFFFYRVASNYHFKRDTNEHHCPPQTLSVFSLLLNLPSNSPPYILLFSHIFSKPPSALPNPPISNPFFFRSGFSRCIFVVGETSARTVNHLYSSIAISLAL